MKLAQLFALIAKLGPKLSDPVLWAAIQALISWFKSLTEEAQEAYLSKFNSTNSPYGAVDSTIEADFPADAAPAEQALIECCDDDKDGPCDEDCETPVDCPEDPDCPCD